MTQKSSLAFILSTVATTPRGMADGVRLHSGRHRVAAPSFFARDLDDRCPPSPTACCSSSASDSLRRPHSLITRPLTAYLRPSESEAPRVERVRLCALGGGSETKRLRSATLAPTRKYVDGARSSGAAKRECDPQRHKSSKFCMVDGCTSRAKHSRRCWKHGGSVQCKVSHCVNRAKSKGVCWSHGGGSPCSVTECDTIAVSNGFCWAHGGGKRCRERGCSRPAFERTRNYCAHHFEALQREASSLLSYATL